MEYEREIWSMLFEELEIVEGTKEAIKLRKIVSRVFGDEDIFNVYRIKQFMADNKVFLEG